ncbi:MAG: rRNA maturation RNase YbeY [Synergistaceae bacterium]|nr:rRNA maturation RNase YbeY [Synergistaceae bacterium]
MKLQLHLDNNDDPDPASRSPLGDMLANAPAVLAAALEDLPEGKLLPGRVEVSLSFLSPDEMREQNRAYRNVDTPTDVLSFPLWEENGIFSPDSCLPILPLGDILICPEYVRRELEAAGEEPFKSAVALMLAHGFLHLLAWDHDTPEREKTMEEMQERIRAALLTESRE